MSDSADIRRELDLVVRRERGRLVADLTRRLGGHNLELAEDVAQEALLKALAVWPYRGIPERPGAWLATVARNLAIDRLRRESREFELGDQPAPAAETDPAVFEARIADPELRLIFLCCHTDLSELERLTLTLKLVSGFNAREVAAVFLAEPAAIGQRVARARRKLQAAGDDLVAAPSRFGIAARLASAMKVIYLMFSLGYAPRSGARVVLRDVAMEALRLSRELADNALTGSPEANALAALLCLQASRFDARQDADGRLVLFENQDRDLWDGALIADGFGYLAAARAGDGLSRYHLEAGIAACHAAAGPGRQCDWPSILGQYRRLEALVDSPVVAVNACVAEALAGDPDAAMARLEALAADRRLENHAPFHIARAEILQRLRRDDEAAASYRRAIECGVSVPVEAHLESRLSSCL